MLPRHIINILNVGFPNSTEFSVKFLGAFAKLPKAVITFVMSVRPSAHLSSWNESAPTEEIFMKFNMNILENLSRIFKFLYNLIRITSTSHKGQNTFLIISRSVLLRLGNVSDNL